MLPNPRLMRTLLSKRWLACSFVKVKFTTVFKRKSTSVQDIMPEVEPCFFVGSTIPHQALILHVWKHLLLISSTMGRALCLISGQT